MKKILFVLGVLVFLNLQYSLLFKNNNISDFIYLKDQNTELLSKISKIIHNNNILKNDIQELSSSTHALENFARYNLGLVKKDEIFIQVIKK
jgi:cell division protein FtsB